MDALLLGAGELRPVENLSHRRGVPGQKVRPLAAGRGGRPQEQRHLRGRGGPDARGRAGRLPSH